MLLAITGLDPAVVLLLLNPPRRTISYEFALWTPSRGLILPSAVAYVHLAALIKQLAIAHQPRCSDCSPLQRPVPSMVSG